MVDYEAIASEPAILATSGLEGTEARFVVPSMGASEVLATIPEIDGESGWSE